MAPCWQERKIQMPWSSILPSGPSDLGHNASLTSQPPCLKQFPDNLQTYHSPPLCYHCWCKCPRHPYLYLLKFDQPFRQMHCMPWKLLRGTYLLFPTCNSIFSSFEFPSSLTYTLQVPWNQWPQRSRTGYWRQRFPRELGKWLLQFPPCSNIQNLED